MKIHTYKQNKFILKGCAKYSYDYDLWNYTLRIPRKEKTADGHRFFFPGIYQEFSDKVPTKKVETYKTQGYLRPLYPFVLPEIWKNSTN